jgi:predicted MFS family arabinose efflux permease
MSAPEPAPHGNDRQAHGPDRTGETPRPGGVSAPSLWSPGFAVLAGITFLTYANISVFFQFHAFLTTLPISPEWFGLIIGAFAGVSLLARPLVSPFFHPGNARPFLVMGTVLVMASLAAYTLAHSLAGILLVRIFHGLAFVVMGSALMALVIEYVPRERSAQFFGILSIIILVPNTLVPPALPALTRLFGGFTGVLLAFSALCALVFPLLALIRHPGAGRRAPAGGSLTGREIRENLTDPGVLALLLSMLMMYSGHAMIFFFLNGFGQAMGFAGTGFFLTLTTAGEIGVRLACGSFLDRADKARTLGATLAGLALCYSALASVPGEWAFFLTGALIGVGWGVAMPVFNGLMFDISRPRCRSMNTNLGMQMFQAGFFFGPFVGGFVVPRWGYGALFGLCALLSLAGALLPLVPGALRPGGTVQDPP